MKIDWKRKLTSRKFWAAVAGFVSMLLIYFGKDAGQAEQIVSLIMAGASLVAYIIGEGLADSADTVIRDNPGTLSDGETRFYYDFINDGEEETND